MKEQLLERVGFRQSSQALVALLLCCLPVAQACGGIASLDVPGGAGGASSSSFGGSDPVSAGAGAVAGSIAPTMGPGGSVSKGATVFAMQFCGSCHGENAAGLFGPNITPSRTAGIGAWSYQQFHDALRFGKDRDGARLCPSMTIFGEKEISEQAMQDLYAYLSSKPAVDRVNHGSFCP